MRFKIISKFVDELTAGPTALEMAQQEIEEAKKSILKAHSNREYVDAMVQYNQARIDRLTEYLTGKKDPEID